MYTNRTMATLVKWKQLIYVASEVNVRFYPNLALHYLLIIVMAEWFYGEKLMQLIILLHKSEGKICDSCAKWSVGVWGVLITNFSSKIFYHVQVVVWPLHPLTTTQKNLDKYSTLLLASNVFFLQEFVVLTFVYMLEILVTERPHVPVTVRKSHINIFTTQS